MTYQKSQADLRDDVIQKYFQDGYDVHTIRVLLKQFNDQYVPTIKIRREMDRLGAVGLNRDWLTKEGYLVQIHRKWTARGKNKARVGHYVYPHLYWASYQQVAEAPIQLWKNVSLCWIPIAELTVVIKDIQEKGVPQNEEKTQTQEASTT